MAEKNDSGTLAKAGDAHVASAPAGDVKPPTPKKRAWPLKEPAKVPEQAEAAAALEPECGKTEIDPPSSESKPEKVKSNKFDKYYYQNLGFANV